MKLCSAYGGFRTWSVVGTRERVRLNYTIRLPSRRRAMKILRDEFDVCDQVRINHGSDDADRSATRKIRCRYRYLRIGTKTNDVSYLVRRSFLCASMRRNHDNHSRDGH